MVLKKTKTIFAFGTAGGGEPGEFSPLVEVRPSPGPGMLPKTEKLFGQLEAGGAVENFGGEGLAQAFRRFFSQVGPKKTCAARGGGPGNNGVSPPAFEGQRGGTRVVAKWGRAGANPEKE